MSTENTVEQVIVLAVLALVAYWCVTNDPEPMRAITPTLPF
jgi:hypothetical protein